MVIVHWSDVSLELPPEELAQVPVVLQVLHVGLLQLAGEEPDVETQQRTPQEHWQLDVVDATPQARQGFQGHAAVQADLWRTMYIDNTLSQEPGLGHTQRRSSQM